MTTTFQANGTLYTFNRGSLTPEPVAVVLTASEERITQGWPVWSYRFTNPMDAKFEGTIRLDGGSVKIYDANPEPFAVKPGGFSVGSHGVIRQVITDYLGTFEDFAVFPEESDGTLNGDPDGLWTLFDLTGSTPTGGPGTAWSQFMRAVYPPKSARFAVPRVDLGSIPAGGNQYLDAFDMRTYPLSELPTEMPTYAKPRHLSVVVKPTRLNYSISPGGYLGTLLSSGFQIAEDYQRMYYGTSGLRVTAPAGTQGSLWVRENQNLEVTPGESLAISTWYSCDAELSGTYRIRVDFYTETDQFVKRVYSTDTYHQNTYGEFVQVTMVVQVPERATKATTYKVYSDDSLDTDDTFWIDATLIEKSDVIGEFFDGTKGEADPESGTPADPDYMWRQDGDPGATWSYYYEDREMRNYILTRVLQENVALGITVDEPQYGMWGSKILDVSPVPTIEGYGRGAYGDGPYGGTANAQNDLEAING